MIPDHPADLHGRTTISARALNRVVTAVAGNALGVEPRRVGTELTDERGRIALAVRAPIRLPSLGGISSEADVAKQGGTILDRVERARSEIKSRVEHITGSSIARIVVRLDSATIERETRVR